MRKYKLFNWKELKREKYKEKDVMVHRFLIPKGYRKLPYQTYIELVHNSIKEYIKVYNEPNQPNYYIFVVDDDIQRRDLPHIYDIICTSFTKVMTQNKLRDDREYRLGLSEIEKTINVNFVNGKRWMNNENNCEIVGMEVIGWQKFWKKRMVK